MAISELQVGLVGAGVVAVAGLFAFNKWQESRHRKAVDQAFNSERRDVLIDEPPLEQPAAETMRVEPVIGSAGAAQRPVHEASMKRVPPVLPQEADERADCVIRIESIEPIEVPRLWAVQQEQLQGISKPVRWFGFSDKENRWEPIGEQSTGVYQWVCVAMQLVDRRGPAGDGDFVRFVEGLQQMCNLFLAIPTLPARTETLGRAAEVDRFCAGVDIQIGVNVVSGEQPFPGTKLRGLAEAGGLVLREDGAFHACDELGITQFTLSNLEPVRFSADGMRNLVTHGVTLMLDVPRVADGARVFDRMMVFARHLAEALHGTVVDDNRVLLGERSTSIIRGQIEQFQAQMAQYGVPAGSSLAARLFAG